MNQKLVISLIMLSQRLSLQKIAKSLKSVEIKEIYVFGFLLGFRFKRKTGVSSLKKFSIFPKFKLEFRAPLLKMKGVKVPPYESNYKMLMENQ